MPWKKFNDFLCEWIVITKIKELCYFSKSMNIWPQLSTVAHLALGHVGPSAPSYPCHFPRASFAGCYYSSSSAILPQSPLVWGQHADAEACPSAPRCENRRVVFPGKTTKHTKHFHSYLGHASCRWWPWPWSVIFLWAWGHASLLVLRGQL